MRDLESIDFEEDNNFKPEDSYKKRINELSINLKKLIVEISNKRKEFESLSVQGVEGNPRISRRNLLYLSEISNYIKEVSNERSKLISRLEQLVRESLIEIINIEDVNTFHAFMLNLYRQIELINIIVENERENKNILKIKEDAQKTIGELKGRELQLNQKINEVNVQISQTQQLLEQTKNLKIHEYYQMAAEDNQKNADLNKAIFIMIILLALTMIWFSLVTKGYFGLEGYDYYFFKGSLVLTSITLITYFLKQSVKYQKFADQCKQTKLELEAFPSYVANLSQEDPLITDLRKELAMKYFGRDVDNKSNDETSNILQDQMKNTTEMVKAAMELIKKSGG